MFELFLLFCVFGTIAGLIAHFENNEIWENISIGFTAICLIIALFLVMLNK